MIVLKRTDGMMLNLTAAKTLTDTKQGLVVEMGDEYFVVPDRTFNSIAEDVKGRWDTLQVVYAEWKGWPNVK